MATSVKVGNLNITTGAVASTVAVSGVGFIPKAIIFWWSGLAAANTGTRATHRRGMGWAVSASSFYSVANFDTDAAANAVSKNNAATDACILEISNTGAIVGKADLQSFDADGFTLEIQDAFVTNLLVSYMAIGGSDITNAEIGSFTPTGAAPVNQTVNNVGNFQPSVTFFMIGAQLAAGADSPFMLGAAVNSSQEAVWWGGANDTPTAGDTATYCRAGECIAFEPNSPSVSPTSRAEFVSHNAGTGGFTINWLERADATTIRYLSIKGGTWLLGDLVTAASLTTVTETSFGFQPKGLLFVAGGNAATVADAAGDIHDEWTVGAATGGAARECQQVASRDGNGTMFTFMAARTDAVYINANPASAAYLLEGLMDIQSIDSDGFTAVMDDADVGSVFVWYVAVSDSPAAGSGNPAGQLVRGRAVNRASFY